MRRALLLLVIAVSPALTFAEGDLWPWSSQAPAAPPTVKPYEVPTFGGKRNFRDSPAQWQKAPRIDGDAVFRAVVACFPSKPSWNIDINLQAAMRTANAIDITGTAIGKHTVGIVASMPLYSATEIDRERQREYQRRAETAKTVAEFVGQLANRNTALRALALSAALEGRAQVRVNEGIADADEQIKYLDRVMKAENDLVSAEAKAMDARLSLVSSCRDEEAGRMNEYLTGLAQLPPEAKP